MIRAGITFWHDHDGHAYARVPGPNGQVQRYVVRGNRGFGMLVREIYGRDHPREMPDGAIIPGSIAEAGLASALLPPEKLGELAVTLLEGQIP